MNYIFINTAGVSVELLVSIAGKTRYYHCVDGKMASEALLPAIDRILAEEKALLSDFDCFACVVGPGSFTGIRIGVGTARALAFALGKSCAGITYNRAIASVLTGKRLSVVSGWAKNYYVAMYDGENTVLEPTVMEKQAAEEFIALHSDYALVCDAKSASVFGGTAVSGSEYMEKAMTAAKITKYDEVEPLYAMQSQAERELKC